MGIATYTIPGMPDFDQLTEPVSLPDRNRQMQCVSTSLADGLLVLTGRHYNGEQVQAGAPAYGPNYVGPMDPDAFVGYCAGHGVDLVTVSGSQQTLLNTVLAEVPQRHPVLVTIPSNWDGPAPTNPVYPTFYTHVVCAYGVSPSQVVAANPWHGQPLPRSLAWWRGRICRGRVWVMKPREGTTGGEWPVLDPAHPRVLGYFDTRNPNRWTLRGKPSLGIDLALLEAYRSYASTGLAGLTEFGLPIANEAPCLDAHGKPIPDAWYQDFERGRLVLDEHRRFDQPPGVTTKWYRGHVDQLEHQAPVVSGGPTDQQKALLQAAHSAAPALSALVSAIAADK